MRSLLALALLCLPCGASAQDDQYSVDEMSAVPAIAAPVKRRVKPKAAAAAKRAKRAKKPAKTEVKSDLASKAAAPAAPAAVPLTPVTPYNP